MTQAVMTCRINFFETFVDEINMTVSNHWISTVIITDVRRGYLNVDIVMSVM